MKRTIDANVRRVANSDVITIPVSVKKKLNIKTGDIIEVEIKVDDKE